MKRSNFLALSIFVVLALGASAAVFAQSQEYPATERTDPTQALSATGSVVSSSTTSLVIRKDDGSQVTFSVDTATTLPSTLAPGETVTVSYSPMGADGKYHATTVTAGTSGMPAGSAGQPSGSSPPPEGTVPPSEYSAHPQTAPSERGSTEHMGEEMPRTASALPLLVLAGILTLGIGLGMRRIARTQAH